MAQRRRWERCRKELPVVIDPGGAKPINATTLDICEGGIGIVCGEPFALGSKMRFEVAEIADGAMTGVVRWCTPSKTDDRQIVGVELEALSALHRDALADKLALWRSQSADEDG